LLVIGELAAIVERIAVSFDDFTMYSFPPQIFAAPAKAAVQSEVWKNRDKKWIELDGEGRQELGKRR